MQKKTLKNSPSRTTWLTGWLVSPIPWPSDISQPKLQDTGQRASVSHGVLVQLPEYAGVKVYCLVTEATCQRPYSTKQRVRNEPVTFRSQVKHSIEPQYSHTSKKKNWNI